MRILRNERHIRWRSVVGKYAALSGLLVLLVGLVASFIKPEWVGVMLGCLTAGFVLTTIGGFYSDRYGGPLAHHEALAAALKGLDDRYTLLQYRLPADHVLVEPGGCTAFAVKPQGGKVSFEKDRWKHRERNKFFRQLVGQEPLAAPDYEAERQARKLSRWLAKQLPGVEVPVRGVIVFVNPDVELDVKESPLPAFYGKKVKSWLRGPGKLKPLTPEAQQALLGALGAVTEE